MQSSPRSPAGTSVSGSSSDTTRQSVSGIGEPIVPASARRTGFTWVTGDVSVSPYPSTRCAPPVTSRTSRPPPSAAVLPRRRCSLDRLQVVLRRLGCFVQRHEQTRNARKNDAASPVELLRAMCTSNRGSRRASRLRDPEVLATRTKEWKNGRMAHHAVPPPLEERDARRPCRTFEERVVVREHRALREAVVPPGVDGVAVSFSASTSATGGGDPADPTASFHHGRARRPGREPGFPSCFVILLELDRGE